jgi:transcriptional regulator GlxA family with amidase domain
LPENPVCIKVLFNRIHLSAAPLSVPQLAARMFLSPGHFSDIFKKEMGTPPGDYLRRLRLNKAQELLRAGKRFVTQIAFDCGFNDAAQFSRAFHATFEITPSDYRKDFRK